MLRQHHVVMDNTDRHHTNASLRMATIAAGAIVGIVLVATSIFTSNESGATGSSVFNSIVFLGAMVWFVTNAFRWLQERLPRPGNHIVFAIIAAFAFGIGARALIDVAVDPPNRTADAVYQAMLAASLIVAGLIALASAVQRLETTEPYNLRHLLIGSDGESEQTPTTLMQSARWLAILGGIVFAVAIFVSPTVIPVAVALTCTVRYACTLSASKQAQTAALVMAAIVVATMCIGLVVLSEDDQSWFLFTLLPSAVLYACALALGGVAQLRISPARQ